MNNLLTAQSEFGERMGHIVVQLVGDHALVHSLVVFLHGIHVQRVRGRCGRAGRPGHSIFQPGHDLLQCQKWNKLKLITINYILLYYITYMYWVFQEDSTQWRILGILSNAIAWAVKNSGVGG